MTAKSAVGSSVPALAGQAIRQLKPPHRTHVQTLLHVFASIGSVLSGATSAGGNTLQTTTMNLTADLSPSNKAFRFLPAETASLLNETPVQRKTLVAFLDGWNALLIRASHRDRTQLNGALDRTGGELLAASARILGLNNDQAAEVKSLGNEIAYVELILNLDRFVAQGRLPIPATLYQEADIEFNEFGRPFSPQVLELLTEQLEVSRKAISSSSGWIDSLENQDHRRFFRVIRGRTLHLIENISSDLTAKEPGTIAAATLALKMRGG